MNHIGTKPIETDRLLLRRFTTDDAQDMYQNWASDGEVTKYLTWPAHADVSVTRAVLASWVKEYENDHVYQWAITVKGEGNASIGSIAVVSMEEETGKAQIGYCIGKAWWGRGITAEALSAVIGFLFEQTGANRIEARHDTNNPNSGRVMQKCGMTYEGTLRMSDKNNQGICDTAWYSILKREYESGAKK